MKQFYTLKLAGLLLATLLAANTGYSQVVVDNTSARSTIIPSNGSNLSGTTYNYVRVPEVITIDTVTPSPAFNFYRSYRLSYATGIDGANPPVPPGLKTRYSDDGGPWTASANIARFGAAAKLKSGKILGLEFVPTYPGPHTWPLVYYTSTNNGASYVKHTDGLIDFGTLSVLGLRVNKNILEESDGSLYTCAYIRYSGEASFRTSILKSTDGGVTWGPMLNSSGGPIEVAASDNLADEGSITRCADGSWMCVMKHTTSDPDVSLPLLYSKSTDKGLHWTTPANLPGNGASASGKNPCAVLLPNGVLAISYGTPDIAIIFSADNGATWTVPVVTYAKPSGSKFPSGNTWVVPVGFATVLQFGDEYAETINPNTQAIWQKELEYVRPEQNRIDLKGKLAAGTLTIMSGTNMTATFASHSEARSKAAFDGSTNYWASAISTVSGSGTYQLDLQQIYHIKTIGTALLYGVPEGATVSLSPDGSNWTAFKNYPSGTTHYAVDYTNITTFDARYVKVDVTGTGTVGLSELELYSTAWTFENNATEANGDTNWPHGILPAGYSPYGTDATHYGVSIAKGNVGYQSDRAMHLYDGSSTWRAGVKKVVTTGTNARNLEFHVRPAAIPVGGSFNFQLLGTVAGAENTVFYFAVFAETSGGTTTYKLKANVGGTWTQVGTATIPVSGSTWKLVRIEGNIATNQAKVYLDGTLMGSTAMFQTGTNLTGFAFCSNGTATSGEDIYFDDVDCYDPTVGPNNTDAVGPEKLFVLQPNAPQMTPTSKVFSVAASPNPANSNIQINISNAVSGPITILISNMSGRVVKKLNYNIEEGSSSISTSVSGYYPGVYVITAQQSSQQAQSKLAVYQ